MLPLQTGFTPADQPTADLVQSIISKVDNRKKGGKDTEALTDIVCSMLALRGVEFAVERKSLTPEIKDAAWAYSSPTRSFEPIRDYLAFYPHLMDACWVDEERVVSQAGGFYGGWITSDIVGPFKGEPGTTGW